MPCVYYTSDSLQPFELPLADTSFDSSLVSLRFYHNRETRHADVFDGAWPEFLVLRLEIEVVDCSGKMFGCFEFAFDERVWSR